MQRELIGTLDTHAIELRLGAIGAKVRELRSLLRQYDTSVFHVETYAAERLDERTMKRAELYDSLVRELDELLARADELLDELLDRVPPS